MSVCLGCDSAVSQHYKRASISTITFRHSHYMTERLLIVMLNFNLQGCDFSANSQ